MQRLLPLRTRQTADLRSLVLSSPTRRAFHSADLRQAWERRHPQVLQNFHEPPPRLYRVRFLMPIFTRRKVLRFILYASTFVVFWKVALPLAFPADELDGEGVFAGKRETLEHGLEVDSDDVLFIPCTWPKKVPRRDYTAKDPEMQAYSQFNRDAERMKRTLDVVARWARIQTHNHPSGRKVFGNIDPDKGNASLFIYYPRAPPQQYEYSGIGITDDYIALMSQRISRSEYDKMCERMFPVKAMKGLWAHLRFHFFENANYLRELFGLEPWTDPESSVLKDSVLKALQSRGQARGSLEAGKDTTNSVPGTGAATDESQAAKVPMSLLLVARSLWSRSKRTSPLEPRRGSLIIKGCVDLVGERRDGLVDVVVHLDPRTHEITGSLITIEEASMIKGNTRG